MVVEKDVIRLKGEKTEDELETEEVKKVHDRQDL